MKQSAGAGAWPALWMLGATGGKTGAEIDIQEGGFRDGSPAIPPKDVMASTFTQADGSSLGTHEYNAGVDLGYQYHTYGLDWEPGQSLTWYLEGKVVAHEASPNVPTVPMELIINNGIANNTASSWHSSAAEGVGSFNTEIASVQIFQHPGHVNIGP